MKSFIQLFNKVGGKEILCRYWRAHVLFFALLMTGILGISKKSLEIVRLAVNNRILGKMRKGYKPFITEYKNNNNETLQKERSNKVWIFWFQGINQAPTLVKKCYYSLQENLIGKEIILLTADNYKNYIQFPNYIQKKIDSGVITKTHMSDLLRLELLIKYGGTWVDATVLCTGKDYPQYIMDSDLFVFQCLKPGLDGHSTSISSWLMTACTNHPILLLTRELLYYYWAKHEKMTDYFLLHDFFQLAIEAYPETWKKVVPFSNSVPHILLLRLFEQYDENVWNGVKRQTCFHKLTYKFEEGQSMVNGTYYDVLLKQ